MSRQKEKLLNIFKTIIWPRRKLLLIGLILIVISRVSGLVLPGASKYLVDVVIAKKDINALKILLGVVIAAILVQAISSFMLTQLLSVEAQRLISALRVKMQQKIMSLPIRFFDNTRAGELASRIMTDVEGVRNLVGTGLVQLIGGLLSATISLFLLIRISPIMTFYVLIPIGLFGFIAIKAFSYIRPIFRERRRLNAEVTGRLIETLNGIRVIKGFGAEKQEIDTFEKGATKLFLNIKKSMISTSLVTSSATLLLGLASAGIMGIGGYVIIQHQMSFGDFLAFTLYLGFMIAPIVQMSNIGSQLTEALAGIDRMDEVMLMTPESDLQQRSLTLDGIQGHVVFKKVSFAYDDNKPVITDISLDAPAGSTIALVGSSGAGKTTIAGLTASFLTPDSGTITIDGKDICNISLESYRKQLGVVLQDDFLFEGTIRENILFARPKASEQQLRAAARVAYVTEFTDRFEDGLETVIGERGIKLSGGQRQRVTIARAVLANPSILILDEATSNLDTESEAFIQESLKELTRGRTTFIIAHRLSTIQQADQILVIEHGKIHERGTHDELINKRGKYFNLYTHQVKI